MQNSSSSDIYPVLYELRVSRPRCTFILLTTTKLITHLVFALKYRVCSQKKFSWIYMNSTSIDIYNRNKNLVNGRLLYIYFCIFCVCSLFFCSMIPSKMYRLTEEQRWYIICEWKKGSINISKIAPSPSHPLYLYYSYISKKISSNYKLYILDQKPSVRLILSLVD